MVFYKIHLWEELWVTVGKYAYNNIQNSRYYYKHSEDDRLIAKTDTPIADINDCLIVIIVNLSKLFKNK